MTGLVDDHAHPFTAQPDRLHLAAVSLRSHEPGLEGAAGGASSLAQEAIRVRLAGLLGCDAEEVEQVRDARAAADWPAHVAMLLADAGIEAMLLDGGPDRVDLDVQSALGAIRTHELLRIEAVVDPMIERGAGAEEILAAVESLVDEGARSGAAGLKTVLAYRTGLRVDPEATLEQAHRSLDGPEPVRRRAKALRDLVLVRTLAQCADLHLPMQVHTGFGDADIRLRDGEPIGLDDVLRSPAGAAAPVVLIHGGFPWHEQVAYLAHVRPRVWAEYSLANLMSPATTADRLLRLIDLAPTDRVLLGTDGHGPPETHWFAAHMLREAWDVVRTRLQGVARASWLDQVEAQVFAGNARELYRLGR